MFFDDSFVLHSYNTPDIQWCCKGKNKTRKQNSRSCEFKLSVFLVIKVCRADFDKEKDSKHHINNREYNIIHNSFNLRLCCVPCAFNRTCHISGSIYSCCRKCNNQNKSSGKYQPLLSAGFS